jgi:putative membrane protein
MLSTVLQALVILIAAEHIWFLVLEMFLWTKPKGLKTFRMSPEKAEHSKVLAANQGLYNGFLSAGLIWSVLDPRPEVASSARIFFLACVVVAGIFGGATVNRRIFFLQAGPAIVALVLGILS